MHPTVVNIMPVPNFILDKFYTEIRIGIKFKIFFGKLDACYLEIVKRDSLVSNLLIKNLFDSTIRFMHASV